jgi:hypothetical protein
MSVDGFPGLVVLRNRTWEESTVPGSVRVRNNRGIPDDHVWINYSNPKNNKNVGNRGKKVPKT